jgi:hypothetical protein
MGRFLHGQSNQQLDRLTMNYALLIDAIRVGPFTTHIAATVFAEQNGYDNYTMVELYDPAEAPGLIHRLNQPLLAVTPRSAL